MNIINKSKFLLFVILAFSISALKAQDYAVALIPDSLKLNAHCVIREDKQEIELLTRNRGIEKIRRVITVLDKDGERMAFLAIPYDKNSAVSIKQITLYDSYGKKIKNAKQSDITDSPFYSSSELFSESRLKYYKPLSPVYPYTVEYNYEINQKNIISLGCWRPFSAYNVSAQHAKLIFSYPSQIKINKKEINIHSSQSERHTDNFVETWEVNNLKAIEHEPFEIDISERIPGVYLMPSVLIYDKYEGTADNWKDYGKWISSLYQGRNDLTEVEKSRLDLLGKEIPDTLDRIKSLYKYLQENTRYVAITLGLGGFQPFDAKTVFETGYGDCKALVNYMYSLLRYIGINSYPAIVSSGRYKEPIFTDFPNFQQFDHVILCVPFQRDTIWLECTDQKIPFGFLGDFTDDRDVLIITENGGKFAHTTKYEPTDNIRSSRSEFYIDSTGNANCTVKTRFSGLQYDDITELLYANHDGQKKWLYTNTALPSMQIKNFSVNDLKGTIPEAIINEAEISRNYCSFSGDYMLLPLNILNLQRSIQKMLRPRYSDILTNRSFVDYDTTVFHVPENYKYESIPASTTLNSKFGSYSSTISADEKQIIYIRKFSLNEGRYKPCDYQELYDFILSVSKADNAKAILIKKPERI